LPSRGVDSYVGSPRSLFARRRSCALRASWGSAPDFAGLTVRHCRGRPRRRRSLCCSTKWSVDSPKRCLGRIVVLRRRKTQSCPGAPSSQKPRLQRCGNSGLGLGLEVRPPSRSKICPPKSGLVFLRCLEPAPMQALEVGGEVPQLRSAHKRLSALFDNPCRSWKMISARSLGYARG